MQCYILGWRCLHTRVRLIPILDAGCKAVVWEVNFVFDPGRQRVQSISLEPPLKWFNSYCRPKGLTREPVCTACTSVKCFSTQVCCKLPKNFGQTFSFTESSFRWIIIAKVKHKQQKSKRNETFFRPKMS